MKLLSIEDSSGRKKRISLTESFGIQICIMYHYEESSTIFLISRNLIEQVNINHSVIHW